MLWPKAQCTEDSRGSPILRISQIILVRCMLARTKGQSCSSARVEFSNTTCRGGKIIHVVMLETMKLSTQLLTERERERERGREALAVLGPHLDIVLSMILCKVEHAVQCQQTTGCLHKVLCRLCLVLKHSQTLCCSLCNKLWKLQGSALNHFTRMCTKSFHGNWNEAGAW